MKNNIKKYRKYLILGLVVVIFVLYLIFGRGSTQTEVYVVKNVDVSQSVVLSGKVQTSDRADLGFASSGRLANIFVKNNESVPVGTVLAQLEIGDLLADLKIKQANLKTSGVDIEAAKSELDRVTNQQNAKVDSAYRQLLSKDLILVPESDNSSLTPPVISGVYNDAEEGQYKIYIDRSYINSSDTQMYISGLEKSTSILNKQSPTSVGTKGLYISFGVEDLSPYVGTAWDLDIPNKSSSSYVTNYNAYIEAKKARDVAVQDAEYKYKKLLTGGDNGSSAVAQGEIDKINAEIKKNTIYAPFSGKVTNIEKEVGESAGVGERVISILGENKLEVVLQVSELDVSRIPANAPIDITLDAFSGEVFHGVLKTINSRDTTVDGVPVYEAFVELPPDPRIKTGMSANGSVVLAEKLNIIAIPSYLIKKISGTNTVEVLTQDEKTEVRNIELGLVGTNSMVEVTSGLSTGEQIVSTVKK